MAALERERREVEAWHDAEWAKFTQKLSELEARGAAAEEVPCLETWRAVAVRATEAHERALDEQIRRVSEERTVSPNPTLSEIRADIEAQGREWDAYIDRICAPFLSRPTPRRPVPPPVEALRAELWDISRDDENHRSRLLRKADALGLTGRAPARDQDAASRSPSRYAAPECAGPHPVRARRGGMMSAWADGEAWEWGDPFPRGTTGCDWRMVGYAAPLLDPNPCSSHVFSDPGHYFGWRLIEGSTSTLRLRDGRWRMYFATGGLEKQDSAKQYEVWPVTDAAGRNKFGLKADGSAETDTDKRNTWWRAAGDSVEDLHFSPDYIGFLDSSDGLSFPLYAPFVTPVVDANCGSVDYTGASVTYSFGSFRAGWRSTAIPSSGSLLYRDPSVVYIADAARYVMLVVECDGRGLAAGGGDLDSSECDICTVDIAHCASSSATTPVTRLVFFTCADADFQEEVKGPFPLAPWPPEAVFGQWVGVPQMLLGPDEEVVLWYVGTGLGKERYGYAGLHAGLACNFGEVIRRLESVWFEGADLSVYGGAVYTIFHNFGAIEVGDAPPDCNPSTLTDEHFVFCEDGRLHLYYANRSSGDVEDPLDLISHAVAGASWQAERMQLFVGPPLPGCAGSVAERPATAEPELAVSGLEHLRPGPSVTLKVRDGAVDGSEIWEERDTEERLKDTVVRFDTVCGVIDLPKYLNTGTVDDGTLAVPVECNDPDVYQAADGSYVALFHSRALGALVLAKADSAEACTTTPECP